MQIFGAGAAGANYVGTIVSCPTTTLTVTPATSTRVNSGMKVLPDDTVALQKAQNAACGKPFAGQSGKLLFPNAMVVNLSSQLLVYGCAGEIFDGGASGGANVGSASFQWTGGAFSGGMILITQSRDITFQNFNCYTGPGVGFPFANVCVDVDEIAPITWITTHPSFKNLFLSQAPHVPNPNFVGLRLANVARGNVEGVDAENVSAQCQGGSTPGQNTAGTGVQIGPGGEPFYVHLHGNQEIDGCSIGWDLQGNNSLVTIDGGLTGSNYYVIYARAGSLATASHIRDEGSHFFLGMLSNFRDFSLDHIAFSGLTSGGTSIDLSNAGSATILHCTFCFWDTMASFTPISPNAGGGSMTILGYNIYPNKNCALNSSFHGVVKDEFSRPNSGGICPNYFGAPFGLDSLTFAGLPTAGNGTILFCSDCKNVADDAVAFDSTAIPGGHGTSVLRENGVWRVH